MKPKKEDMITLKIKTKDIQALLEGKKLSIQSYDHPIVELIPERYGVFMTFDKYEKLKRDILWNLTSDPNQISQILADIFEKTLNVNPIVKSS